MGAQSVLNWWIGSIIRKRDQRGEFLGFVKLSKDADYIGMNIGDEVVAPLFLFQDKDGWGDETKTSEQFSWVLYVKGVDDHSLYRLFETRDGAIEAASIFLKTSVNDIKFWMLQN